MDYKEQIEKEAKEYADILEGDFHGTCRVTDDCFIECFESGVNSKISERIKIDYCISVLNKLSVDNGVVGFIENKITELKKQRDGK